MSEDVSIEVLSPAASRTSVEVIEQQGARTVEVEAGVRPAVEVTHPGPQGPSGTSRLLQMDDVEADDRTNGSVLYYDATKQKAVFDSIETKINLTDGGNF